MAGKQKHTRCARKGQPHLTLRRLLYAFNLAADRQQYVHIKGTAPPKVAPSDPKPQPNTRPNPKQFQPPPAPTPLAAPTKYSALKSQLGPEPQSQPTYNSQYTGTDYCIRYRIFCVTACVTSPKNEKVDDTSVRVIYRFCTRNSKELLRKRLRRFPIRAAVIQ